MADKRTNIPHQAGAIAASTWSNPSGQKPQDLVDGYVVGKDNATGQAIVTDGASQLKGITQGEVSIYQFAAFTRPESGEGGRLGRIQATGENFSAIDTPALTQNTTDAKAVQGCGTAFGSGQRDSPKPELTEEQLPSEPPEEPEPEEPPATIEEIANSSPYNPQPNPADEDTGTGCTTTSDCQWYDAISLDQPCPYGTTKQGATEITPGVFMILCCGEERPVGDGCPVDSSQLGWTCTNGTCTQTQGGQFATEEECLASGCLKQTWTCTQNGCVEVFDGSGEFDSLEECQLQCSGLGWDCVNGTCQQVSGGRFATQALCEASGCGAGSASPITDYCDGNAGAVLTWSSGSVESFNPPISYSVEPPSLSKWICRYTSTVSTRSFTLESTTEPFTVGSPVNGSGTWSYVRFKAEVVGTVVDCTTPPVTASLAGGFAPCWSAQEIDYNGGQRAFLVQTSGGVTDCHILSVDPFELCAGSSDYALTVFDATGVIFSQSYASEPTGFAYSCRN